MPAYETVMDANSQIRDDYYDSEDLSETAKRVITRLMLNMETLALAVDSTTRAVEARI